VAQTWAATWHRITGWKLKVLGAHGIRTHDHYLRKYLGEIHWPTHQLCVWGLKTHHILFMVRYKVYGDRRGLGLSPIPWFDCTCDHSALGVGAFP
jgi:hypothetical protein